MAEPQSALGRSILIIDDDLNLLELHAALFSDAGYAVKTAKDGQEGWEALDAGYLPSLVFTGIKMPRLDGFSLFRKLRSDPRFQLIPVVVYSHQGFPEDEKTAKELGAADFIARGTTPPGEVLRRINALLGAAKKMKIAIVADRFDGSGLVHLLNLQNGISLPPNSTNLNILVEPMPQK